MQHVRRTPWYELILTVGVLSWSVWFDRRRFIIGLVAQAMWDAVSSQTRTPRRTDLERFAEGLEWLDLSLRKVIYGAVQKVD